MIPVTVETLVVGGPEESKLILRPVMDNRKNPSTISIKLDMAEALILSLAAQKDVDAAKDDLSLKAIETLGWHFSRVVIYDYVDDEYLANVVLQKDFRDTKIQAKPYDAIALALKARAPIYVSPDVFDKVGTLLVDVPSTDRERDALEFHRFINDISPDDFMGENDLDELLKADSIDDLLGSD